MSNTNSSTSLFTVPSYRTVRICSILETQMTQSLLKRNFLIYLFSSHSHLHKTLQHYPKWRKPGTCFFKNIVYELRWPKCLWDSLKFYDIILSEFLLKTMLANYLLFVTIMKVSKQQLNASNRASYSQLLMCDIISSLYFPSHILMKSQEFTMLQKRFFNKLMHIWQNNNNKT